MNLLGRWRIVEMADYTDDTDAVAFSWTGNDEMDEAQGDGWAKLQPNGSLKGAICFHGGDEANFIARREASSTAC